jgi:site-specific DNA recombinase
MQPPRAVIYARISQADETKSQVADQVASCREWAKKHGYKVVAEYTDDGISAWSGKTRPGFELLKAAISSRSFDILVAPAEDRLSRQPRESFALSMACAEAGIRWHTIIDGLTDPATEDGELFTYLRGWIGRREQTQKVFRQREAYEAMRQRGKPLGGGRPFGFDKKRLAHVANEVDELRWAYAHLLAGNSIYSIVKSWNERKVLTARGNVWSYQSVRQVLMRPRNAGFMDHKGEILYDVQAQWEPIVSREDWEATRAVVTDPSRSPEISRKARWLCGGIVRCGVCGQPMRPSTSHDRKSAFRVYRCHSGARAPGTDPRRHTSVKIDDLDPLVVDAIVSSFLLGSVVTALGTSSEKAELGRLGAKLSKVNGELEALVYLIGKENYPQHVVEKRASELNADKRSLEANIAEVHRQAAYGAMLADSQQALFVSLDGRKQIDIDDAVRVRAGLKERFLSLPLAQQRTLVKAMLEVTVHPGRKLQERIEIRHLVVPSLDADYEERMDEKLFPVKVPSAESQ